MRNRQTESGRLFCQASCLLELNKESNYQAKKLPCLTLHSATHLDHIILSKLNSNVFIYLILEKMQLVAKYSI